MTDPMFVKILGERVKSWQTLGSFLVIQPNNASFDELVLKNSLLPFSFETKMEIGCSIRVRMGARMKGREKTLLRELKGLESALVWKGFLGRKPYFASGAGVTRPMLQSSCEARGSAATEDSGGNVLAEALNTEVSLMRLIRGTKPTSIVIYLSETGFVPEHNENLAQGLRKESSSVLWSIRLSYGAPQPLTLAKTAVKLYNVLNMISRVVRALTEARASAVTLE